MKLTEIQTFYKNKTVFITGGTGILGILLVEKLLRSCSEIKQIVLPIRAKRNVSTKERIHKYFSEKVYDMITTNQPEIIKKVVFLSSNLNEKCCGFNEVDYNFVKSSVNIIFHCAATVDFFAPLSEAVNSNIKITQNIINLAKEIIDLKALIYVSTLRSHTILDYTDEKVHNLSYKPEFLYNLLDNVDEDTLKKITPILLKDWPNTYVMTKHIAECIVDAEKDNLPVAIFRPAIVVSTLQEPIPGWMSSFQAAITIGISLAAGTTKVIPSNTQYSFEIVPADLVINCMIAIAWHTATQKKNRELQVYNYAPVMNPISRKKYFDSFVYTKFPLDCTVWTPGYIATNSKRLYEIYALLYHTIPGYICDMLLKIQQQKPRFAKIMKTNKKLLKMSKDFMILEFKIEYRNIPALWNSLQSDDQQLFNFDLDSVNWDEYMDILTKSAKYMLNEDFNNMEKAEANRYLLRCKY